MLYRKAAVLGATLGGLVLGALAGTPANASLIQIDFSILETGSPVATGTFTYDNASSPSVLSYGDLASFSLAIAGTATVYDLAYVLQPSHATNSWFVFDTGTNMLTPGYVPGLFGNMLIASMTTGYDGFDFNSDSSDFSSNVDGYYHHPWDQVTYRVTDLGGAEQVPEPESLALLGGGLLVARLAFRRRKARA